MILTLDFASDIPIYIQIRNEIVQAMADGRLSDGEKLPTVRALAAEVGINSMTVNKAYQMLKQEGYIITDRRNGARVHCRSKSKKVIKQEIRQKLELAVAESKTGGLSEEELVEIVRELYNADGSMVEEV